MGIGNIEAYLLVNSGFLTATEQARLKDEVISLPYRWHSRKQFSRCGYASTPAFGRAVRAFGLTFCGTVETVPFRVVVVSGIR
jgi:hypothetical protein